MSGRLRLITISSRRPLPGGRSSFPPSPLPRRPYAILAIVLASAACPPSERDTERLPPPPDSVPAAHARGAALYAERCASCHGEHGRGSAQGPPLVHAVYAPSHHGDAAFELAARLGVKAHHWRFGDMPAIPTVATGDVREVTAFVRWLQREAGIVR